MLKNKNLIKIFTLITFLIMITVNALANIFPDQVWTIIILFVGAIIAALTTIREKNLAYDLVPVWAYFGIYLKHSSPDFFNGMYPNVILTTIVCMAIFLIIDSCLLFKKEPL